MPRRRNSGSRSLGLSEFRELLQDGRVWAALGVVVKRPGENSHFEIADGDVLVEVDLMPNGEPLTCRLGAGTQGVWKVPAVNSEVMVLIPGGELDAGPMISGVLSSGTVDSALDADTLVVTNPGKVIIKSDNDKVTINGDTYDLPKWNAFFDDVSTWITQVHTLLSALVVPTAVLAPALAAYTTPTGLPTSIVVKKATPSNYVSDKAKNG